LSHRETDCAILYAVLAVRSSFAYQTIYDEVAMKIEFFNPPTLCPTFGWTHAVSVTGGKIIYVSGQVAVDDRGQVVGKGDLRTQTDQAFKNIVHALAAAGATFADVVKTNLYVVGLKPEHVPIIREVRARYVRADHPPVSTLVGVSALVGPDWLIEIEAEAVVNG
jgi:enamine deaminase RidA (YjgF/YER057c/UK114 family)